MRIFTRALGVSRFFRAGMDLLFPARCHLCGSFLATGALPHFCPQCLEALPLCHPPCCSKCGLPLLTGDIDTLCGSCLVTDSPLHRTRFLLSYDETVVRLVHGFKFRGDFSMLSSVGLLFKRSGIKQYLAPFDCIVPVPLASGRLRRRGFNQSLLLARIFFPEHTEKIRVNLLKRAKGGSPQRGLSGDARRINVRGIFHVKYQENIRGKSVLVVDDVLTTGATMAECARVLVDSGALLVQGVTLARVLP